MYLDGKRLFLAGATGLAGASLLLRLRRDFPGTRVRACSLAGSSPLGPQPNVEFLHGDLRNLDDCRRLVRGCDCAIMAAANTGGAAAAQKEPWRQVGDNVIMDVQMLQAFHDEGVRRVVFISTATVYQDFEGFIREEQLDWGRDPFAAYLGVGWAKRYAEKLCAFWHAQDGREILIARAANIYGPFARFDPATANFIPALIRKAVARQDPFEVWGGPEVTRDAIFSEDFAEAVLALLNHEELRSGAFNLGSGVKTTVGQAVELILKHAGHAPAKIVYSAGKPTGVSFRALDCSKARDALKWNVGHSVEEGIRKTIAWWRENKETWTR
jgi:GDP-L-fucose synthase